MLLTRDCWYNIAKFLDIYDINSLRQVCKITNRACKFPDINKLFKMDMIDKYKPNMEQLKCIQEILLRKSKLISITGNVGSGKSVTAFISALNLVGYNSKILINSPPTLIKQWNDLIIEKFGIIPVIFHSTNKHYKNKDTIMSYIQQAKVIISSRILSSLLYTTNIVGNEAVEILDETKFLYGAEKSIFKHKIILNIVEYVTYNSHNLQLKDCQFIEDMEQIEYRDYNIPHSSSIANWYEADNNMVVTSQILLSCISYGNVHKLPIFPNKYEFKIENKKHTYYTLYPEKKNPIFKTSKFNVLKKLLTKIVAAKSRSILFDNRCDMLLLLADALVQRGFDVYLYSSAKSITHRINSLNKFKKSKTGILLSSYKLMAEGHNIPEANHCILYSKPLNSEQATQAEGRCRRFPQKNKVYVHRFNSYIEKFNREGLVLSKKQFHQALTYFGDWNEKGYQKTPQIEVTLKNQKNIKRVKFILANFKFNSNPCLPYDIDTDSTKYRNQTYCSFAVISNEVYKMKSINGQSEIIFYRNPFK